MKTFLFSFRSLSLFLLSVVFVPSITFASTFTVSPEKISVHVGESFSVRVNVDPLQKNNYTVKLDSTFTPSILRLDTWKFDDAWTVLRQPGYDSYSNTLGTLVRTGGYPGGFNTRLHFGTAYFVATKEGKGTIRLTQNSFVYDEAGQNTLSSGKEIAVTVLPALPKAITEQATPVPVDYKFDIALESSQVSVLPENLLPVRVHLTNLSSQSEKITVPVHYLLMDSRGAVTREETQIIDLETKNKNFDYALNIPANAPTGVYTLVARVEYEHMTEPVESKAVFTVENKSMLSRVSLKAIFGDHSLLFVVIVLGISAFFFFQHRKRTPTRKKRANKKHEKETV